LRLPNDDVTFWQRHSE